MFWKLSRSIEATASRLLWRSAETSDCLMRSRSSKRFGRLVSASWVVTCRRLCSMRCCFSYCFLRTDCVLRKQYEKQHRIEQSLRHVTTHDALTNLPNRLLLLDRIKQSLVSAERHNNLLAVASIDLDNFQNINDSLGHEIGDQ